MRYVRRLTTTIVTAGCGARQDVSGVKRLQMRLLPKSILCLDTTLLKDLKGTSGLVSTAFGITETLVGFKDARSTKFSRFVWDTQMQCLGKSNSKFRPTLVTRYLRRGRSTLVRKNFKSLLTSKHLETFAVREQSESSPPFDVARCIGQGYDVYASCICKAEE